MVLQGDGRVKGNRGRRQLGQANSKEVLVTPQAGSSGTRLPLKLSETLNFPFSSCFPQVLDCKCTLPHPTGSKIRTRVLMHLLQVLLRVQLFPGLHFLISFAGPFGLPKLLRDQSGRHSSAPNPSVMSYFMPEKYHLSVH